MAQTEKYNQIKSALLKKEAMQALYCTNRIVFHNIIIAIMENTEGERL